MQNLLGCMIFFNDLLLKIICLFGVIDYSFKFLFEKRIHLSDTNAALGTENITVNLFLIFGGYESEC